MFSCTHLVRCVALLIFLSTLSSYSSAAENTGERLVQVGNVKLAVKDLGPRRATPVLLVPGSGMQLIEWPEELIDGLTRRGRRVVIFDNRDAGLSTHFTKFGVPDFTAFAKGLKPTLPYSGEEMADDVLGLLSALKLDKVDLIGISGGATQAQLAALKAPSRIRSLTLIAANSGNPAHPMPSDPERMSAAPPPQPGTKEQLIAAKVKIASLLAGRSGGFDPVLARQRAEQAIERDADPFAATRQGLAIFLLGDLRERQAGIKVPTTVIHGTDDPLISIASGEDVARTIPGARMVRIDGMGHEISSAAVQAILTAIDGTR